MEAMEAVQGCGSRRCWLAWRASDVQTGTVMSSCRCWQLSPRQMLPIMLLVWLLQSSRSSTSGGGDVNEAGMHASSQV